ncbi:hypothetical protein AB0C49_17570, partial [Streptomyces sp. NPDC048577]
MAFALGVPLTGLATLLFPAGTAVAVPAVHPAAVTADCVPAAMGRHTGEFTAAGQTVCLELSSPEGARIAGLTSRGGAGTEVTVDVVDATGTARCDQRALAAGSCALTGTAPFRALVRAVDSDATGPFGLHLIRTDSPRTDACPVLPAGSFSGDAAAVAMETGDGVFSHCLTIPGDAHAAAELFRFRYAFPDDIEEFPDYAVSLVDTAGDGPSCTTHPTPGQQLRTDILVSCSLTPGGTYTVLVEGQDQAATHTVEHHDVTSSAEGCAATAATAVGAPAVAGASGANGTLRCHRITTDAESDRLLLDARDVKNSTHILVTKAGGEIACYLQASECLTEGSTSYQVVTQVPQDWTLPDGYRLDAWRVATAAGPAPECTRAGSVAYGYGPVTGTLSEERTGMCAVLPTIAGDRFLQSITSTDGGTVTPKPAIYNSTGRNLCSGDRCQALDQSVFFLSLPDGADRTAYRAELVCDNAPCGPEDHSVGTVTPATAQSGTVATLTVTGTALSKHTTVRLSNGATRLTGTTTWVAGDARTLKATVDLRGAAPGGWDVSVLMYGSSYARGSLTVTPPAVSGSTFKPLTPTRLMDTRTGLGVPKAKIGPRDTATLQVTGTAGIPTTGVTAVVLNVTATNPTTSSYISAYPNGTTRAGASNLNVTTGQTIPNLVIVPVINGKISFYNHNGTVDLLADVSGYYTTDTTGSTFKPLTPTRLMDTRTGLGVPKAKIGPRDTA